MIERLQMLAKVFQQKRKYGLEQALRQVFQSNAFFFFAHIPGWGEIGLLHLVRHKMVNSH